MDILLGRMEYYEPRYSEKVSHLVSLATTIASWVGHEFDSYELLA